MFDWAFWSSPCACCCPIPDDHGRRHVQTLEENDQMDRSLNHTHSDLRGRSNENGVLKHPETNREIDRPFGSDHTDMRDISKGNGVLKHPETDHEIDRPLSSDNSDLRGISNENGVLKHPATNRDIIDRPLSSDHTDLRDISKENGVLKHPEAKREIDRPLSSDNSDLRGRSNENGVLKHPEADRKIDRPFGSKDNSDLRGSNNIKSLKELQEIANERDWRFARRNYRPFDNENDSRFDVTSTLFRKQKQCGSEDQVTFVAPVEDSPESKTLMLNSLKDMKKQLLESESDKSSEEILKDFVKNASVGGYDNGIKGRLKKFNKKVESNVNWYFQEKLEKIGSQEFVTEVVKDVEDNLKISDFFKEESDDLKEGLTEVVEAMIAKHKRDQNSSGVEVPEIK